MLDGFKFYGSLNNLFKLETALKTTVKSPSNFLCAPFRLRAFVAPKKTTRYLNLQLTIKNLHVLYRLRIFIPAKPAAL